MYSSRDNRPRGNSDSSKIKKMCKFRHPQSSNGVTVTVKMGGEHRGETAKGHVYEAGNRKIPAPQKKTALFWGSVPRFLRSFCRPKQRPGSPSYLSLGSHPTFLVFGSGREIIPPFFSRSSEPPVLVVRGSGAWVFFWTRLFSIRVFFRPFGKSAWKFGNRRGSVKTLWFLCGPFLWGSFFFSPGFGKGGCYALFQASLWSSRNIQELCLIILSPLL